MVGAEGHGGKLLAVTAEAEGVRKGLMERALLLPAAGDMEHGRNAGPGEEGGRDTPLKQLSGTHLMTGVHKVWLVGVNKAVEAVEAGIGLAAMTEASDKMYMAEMAGRNASVRGEAPAYPRDSEKYVCNRRARMGRIAEAPQIDWPILTPARLDRCDVRSLRPIDRARLCVVSASR